MRKTAMFLGMLAVGFANAQYEGKVGINTDTPSATLNVQSKENSGKILELQNASNVKRVTVLHDGKVGIGTQTPSELLHIKGKARIEGLATNAGANTDKVVVVDNAGVLKSVDRSTLGGSGSTSGGTTLDAITGGVRTVTNITVDEWAKWTAADGSAVNANTAGAVPTFALIFTGTNAVQLPNPANYRHKIIAVNNQSATTVNFAIPAPKNNSSIEAGSGFLLLSDGTNWYVIGGGI